jgi:hypothetical protein
MIDYNAPLTALDKCDCNTHIYCKELRDYIICYKMNDSINEKLNENLNQNLNENLNENLIRRYLKIMQEIECWSLEYEVNINIIKYIFLNFIFSLEMKKSLFTNQNPEIIQLYFNTINLNDITDIELENIFTSNVYNSTIIKDTVINNINFSNTSYVKKIFTILVKTDNFILINKLLDNKIDVTYDEFLTVIAKLCCLYKYKITLEKTNFKNFMNKLILSGGTIKKTTMLDIFNKIIEIRIKHLNNYNFCYFNPDFYEFIQYLIDNNCDTIMFPMIKFFTDLYKAHPYISNFSLDTIGNIINLLFDSGMKLKKEDVAYLIEFGIAIKSYSKLDFPIDCDEIGLAQTKHKKKLYKIKERHNIESLRDFCRTNMRLDKLKELCKSVKPDIICLENACRLRHNENIIRYMCDNYNLQINDKCIVALLKSSNSTIGFYIASVYENDKAEKAKANT